MQKKLDQIEKNIDRIKKELVTIGEMRPGSLTLQYQNPREKKGAFYQISYTHHTKSRTQHVRPEFVRQLQEEIKNYKRFKKIMIDWVDLSIERSLLKIDLAKKAKNDLS